MSYPKIRTFIRQGYAQTIIECYGKPDVIAGVATGGIAQGALVAEELGLPFIYIRSSAKGHGMGNMIEGYFEKGQKVVVIEDLISTGGSSLKAVQALRDAGLEVKGLVAAFSYGFKEADENFKKETCPYVVLSNYDFLIETAVKNNYITNNDLESLKNWKENPSNWNI